MAEKWHNIADEKLVTFLGGLDRALTDVSIPYMIYGGFATQTHIARYLTKIHGRDLLDLATSGDIDISNYMRSTDNVDIALGLVQDASYMVKMTELKKQNEEAEKEYKKTRKFLLRGKRGALDKLDRDEEERKAKFYSSVKAVEDERRTMRETSRDKEFNSTFDSFVEGELESLTGGSPITVKQIRRGYGKLVYTLGEYGSQNDREPLIVNICREARDVSKNGCLKELDAELYSNFLFGAVETGRVKIPYMDTNVSLRVMTPEDLLITKILMWRQNDREDAQRLVRYARESGNPINLGLIEKVVYKEREVVYKEDGKEKRAKIVNPVLVERYETFKKYVGLK